MTYRPWIEDPDDDPVLTDEEIDRFTTAAAKWMKEQDKKEAADTGGVIRGDGVGKLFVDAAGEILHMLSNRDIPVTKQNFVGTNWDGNPPRPWDTEALQDRSLWPKTAEPESNPYG